MSLINTFLTPQFTISCYLDPSINSSIHLPHQSQLAQSCKQLLESGYTSNNDPFFIDRADISNGKKMLKISPK